MDVEVVGDGFVDGGEEPLVLTARWRRRISLITVPSEMLNAANRLVTPLRR